MTKKTLATPPDTASLTASATQAIRPRIRRSIPCALEGVALIDAIASASGGGVGLSWWYAAVKARTAPQPVVKAPRFTRWKLSDVRNFWAGVAAQADVSAGE